MWTSGHQLSGFSLFGPINSTPSIGMSFSLMAFCKHTHTRASVIDSWFTGSSLGFETQSQVFSHFRGLIYNHIHNCSHARICTWTHVWYLWNNSLHGSALRSPFRNFSANQRLKHWSYSRLSSVQPSPTLFIFLSQWDDTLHGFNVVCQRRSRCLFRNLSWLCRTIPRGGARRWRHSSPA